MTAKAKKPIFTNDQAVRIIVQLIEANQIKLPDFINEEQLKKSFNRNRTSPSNVLLTSNPKAFFNSDARLAIKYISHLAFYLTTAETTQTSS